MSSMVRCIFIYNVVRQPPEHSPSSWYSRRRPRLAPKSCCRTAASSRLVQLVTLRFIQRPSLLARPARGPRARIYRPTQAELSWSLKMRPLHCFRTATFCASLVPWQRELARKAILARATSLNLTAPHSNRWEAQDRTLARHIPSASCSCHQVNLSLALGPRCSTHTSRDPPTTRPAT